MRNDEQRRLPPVHWIEDPGKAGSEMTTEDYGRDLQMKGHGPHLSTAAKVRVTSGGDELAAVVRAIFGLAVSRVNAALYFLAFCAVWATVFYLALR